MWSKVKIRLEIENLKSLKLTVEQHIDNLNKATEEFFNQAKLDYEEYFKAMPTQQKCWLPDYVWKYNEHTADAEKRLTFYDLFPNQTDANTAAPEPGESYFEVNVKDISYFYDEDLDPTCTVLAYIPRNLENEDGPYYWQIEGEIFRDMIELKDKRQLSFLM